jgi:hypothetical protein
MANMSEEGGHNPGETILEGGHVFDSLFSIAEGAGGMHALEHMAEGTAAAGVLEGASPFMAGFGGVLGGFNMGKGAAEMMNAWDEGDITNEQGSQGALDLVSGGLGVASSAAYLATGAICPPLAIAAGVAGLGAFGNEFAQEHGMYGQHQNEETGEMENATFLNSITDTAGAGWEGGHELFGDNIAGDIAGGIAGGVGAVGQTAWNGLAAVGGGVARLGSGLISLLSDERFKQDIAPIANALDLLEQL